MMYVHLEVDSETYTLFATIIGIEIIVIGWWIINGFKWWD